MNDTPVKKISFAAAGKENQPIDAALPVVDEIKKPVAEETTSKAVSIAPTLRPEEADEPLLQENPNRFVLFPIKYHEVSRVDASRVKCF